MKWVVRWLAYVAGSVVAARAVVSRRDSSQVEAGTAMSESSPISEQSKLDAGLLACLRAMSWKRLLGTAAVLLLAVGVGGFLVAASGVIPIKASSGHWAITEWLLQFSMKRSIATHTLGMQAPPLDDPALVLKGAGHYETGCFPCHGSPELPHPRVAAAMLPPPPYLPPHLGEWDDAGLFYLVKHGVKFTGMPAWPAANRADEVWAMVAFLRVLPDLDAEAYRSLVNGEAADSGNAVPLEELAAVGRSAVADIISESCARCHGFAGEGRGNSAFPILAGQRVPYLLASLRAYAGGERHSGIMEPVAAGLEPEEMQALAEYFGGRPAVGAEEPARSSASASAADPARAIERGKVIAVKGIPKQRVPACAGCHGPNDIRQNPIYPILAGQFAGYLELQLELFKKGHRGGTAFSHVMREVAGGLKPEQMRDVAAYYSSLDPADEISGSDGRASD